MSTIRFNNFTASSRKDDMRPFALMPSDSDLSWINSARDAVNYDLSGQIDGSTSTFTLPVAASFVILRWNDAAVYQSAIVPGFTLAGGVTVTTNFVPHAGDNLVARCWPA